MWVQSPEEVRGLGWKRKLGSLPARVCRCEGEGERPSEGPSSGETGSHPLSRVPGLLEQRLQK